MSHVRAAVLALLSLAACVPPAAKYDPFRVPRESFYGSLKVVALAPLKVPKDLEGAEDVKARFTSTLEARLAEAGLRVVPAEEVGPVIDAAESAQGGVFDPRTGEFDKAKAAEARKDALAQLRTKHGADVLLEAGIRVVRARLDHDVARWDGVTDSAGTGFWKAFFVGSHSGHIPALSFVVWLHGADGQLLYANGGGLRVLVKVNARGEQVRLEHDELFADEARNTNAVRLALDPLLAPAAPQALAPAANPE